MGYEILDPETFLENGVFFEKNFREKIEQFDWQLYDGQRVLVRGCTKILPSWAYMVLAVKLVKFASVVYYGSEGDRIPIYNRRLDG